MSLANPAAFFDALRKGLLGPTLSPSEVSGVEAILAACEGLPLAYVAYALGTAYLETNHEMQPVHEIGSDAYFTRRYDPLGARPDKAIELGNIHAGDGPRFHGRGFPQLTGRRNYGRANLELHRRGVLKAGESLISTPDLALRLDVASAVMRYGMEEGWFTGRGFARYLPAKGRANVGQFMNARAIINGQDRASDIADYSLQFQQALTEGGWA